MLEVGYTELGSDVDRISKLRVVSADLLENVLVNGVELGLLIPVFHELITVFRYGLQPEVGVDPH
jgi:hypothetical protein